ncbi:hypothetical protein KI387_009757, partial [Taxus chinensis]
MSHLILGPLCSFRPVRAFRVHLSRMSHLILDPWTHFGRFGRFGSIFVAHFASDLVLISPVRAVR